MALSIHVLLENRRAQDVNQNLVARPGLSLLLQDERDTVLFDTGPDDSFFRNATLMGLSFDHLSAVVLSHGHYDHCGGLPWLTDHTRIICHPAIEKKRYASLNLFGYTSKIKCLSVDNDFSRFDVEYTCAPLRIGEKFLWSGEIKNHHPTSYGIIEQESGITPDYMEDEGSLIYLAPQGLVIFTGCGHRGIENIVRHCQEITGIPSVYALIGGFHLRYASPWKLWTVRRFLKEINPHVVMACHCTGLWGRAWLPQCANLSTGQHVVLS